MGGSIINNGTLEAKGADCTRTTDWPEGRQGGHGRSRKHSPSKAMEPCKWEPMISAGTRPNRGIALSYYPSLDGTLGLKGDSGVSDLTYSSGTLTTLTPPLAIDPFGR